MLKRMLLVMSVLSVVALAAPAATQASPEGVPPGVYLTHITPADVPADFPPDVAAALPGTWELEITASGVYIAHKDGQFVVFGKYVSNRRRFIMHDELGPFACTGAGQKTGIYDWSFDGENLILTPVHDNCAARRVPTTSHPLELQ